MPPSFTKEWRCTRVNLYPMGTDRRDMQGHYIRSDDKDGALAIMHERYPYERIHAQLWKTKVSNPRRMKHVSSPRNWGARPANWE